jgi:hypothetical protein
MRLMRPLSLVLLWPLCLAAGEIGERNIRYVDYPGFPDAHSTWGSIGYCSAANKVFIGVTNHRDRVGLFEYDVAAPHEPVRLRAGSGAPPRLPVAGQDPLTIVEGPGGAM